MQKNNDNVVETRGIAYFLLWLSDSYNQWWNDEIHTTEDRI